MSQSLSNGSAELKKWTEDFHELEKDYKEAYHSIDKAIQLDEQGKPNEALPLYEFGLTLIDKALDLPLNEPAKPDFLLEKALVMIQKLKKSRKEIVIRIENLKPKPQPEAAELPPSYEEVISNLKSELARMSTSNGNTFDLPGPSKTDAPYIPPSAVEDKELLANLHFNEQGKSETSVTYSDLSQQLKEMKLARNEEFLFHCDNVQLYFISPDGRVSSTSEPNTLIIARVQDETSRILDEVLLNIVSDLSREMFVTKKKKHKHKHRHYSSHKRQHKHKDKKFGNKSKDETVDQSKRTFLQVGSWVYPLIPEISPCLRSEFQAFIFPDIHAEVEGAAVGIIVPEEVHNELHELLTVLLNEISSTGRSRRSVAIDSSSDTFPSKIVQGASYLARNLIKGAGSTARFLDYSTPKIIDRINPSSEPTEISPGIQKTFEIAKTVTGKAVDVTDYLGKPFAATKICLATSALGRYLSPYVHKQGTRLLTSASNMTEEEASEKINSLLNFTSNAMYGVSTLYGGLDTAASILGHSLANNTVQIIQYKYGPSVGALTNDAITTFENVYHTHHNFRVLKPKGFAKAAVRGAGQALLEEYRNSPKSSKPHEEFKGSGPGDGSGFPSC